MLNIDIDTGGTMTDGLVSGVGPADGSPQGLLAQGRDDAPRRDHRLPGRARGRSRTDRGGRPADLLYRGRADPLVVDHHVERRWRRRSARSSACSCPPGTRRTSTPCPEAAPTVSAHWSTAEDITGIAADADDDEVRSAVKGLFDKGSGGSTSVCRARSRTTPADRKIVAMIDAEYPDHYLGSIPALPAARSCCAPTTPPARSSR